jgi:hypothetical protein
LEVILVKGFVVFLVIVLLGACYFSLSYHVITTQSGKIVVRKKGIRFAETFVDVRGWGLEDLQEHPALVDALMKGGHEDLIDHIAGTEEGEEPVRGGLGGVLDPVIESQSSSRSQKTGARAAERARTAGDR